MCMLTEWLETPHLFIAVTPHLFIAANAFKSVTAMKRLLVKAYCQVMV